MLYDIDTGSDTNSVASIASIASISDSVINDDILGLNDEDNEDEVNRDDDEEREEEREEEQDEEQVEDEQTEDEDEDVESDEQVEKIYFTLLYLLFDLFSVLRKLTYKVLTNQTLEADIRLNIDNTNIILYLSPDSRVEYFKLLDTIQVYGLFPEIGQFVQKMREAMDKSANELNNVAYISSYIRYLSTYTVCWLTSCVNR